MTYKRLWIFVEGNDDERFIENIRHMFAAIYDHIQIWKYAQVPPPKIRNLLRSIRAMKESYFFLTDINHSPCITAKKERVQHQYTGIDTDSIRVVIKEIESWYLAGLNENGCKELGIGIFGNTDNVTKEQFNSLIPQKMASRIDFMVEILRRFSVETATQKNASFSYFMSKIPQ